MSSRQLPAFSYDQSKDCWFEPGLFHSKSETLSSDRKLDCSRLTGSTQACHGHKDASCVSNGDLDCRLKISHSANVGCEFQTTSE